MTAPDDMLKLAACPFCGKDDIDRNSDKWGHWFYCSGCEAQDARGHSPAEATMNWNTRASAQRPTGGEVVATSLSIDDLLILLAEECSEVIKAATKCLRFGFDIDHGVDYGNNRMVLSREVGDLLAIIEALPLDRVNVEVTRSGKIAKAEKAKQQYGRTAAPSETGHVQSEGKCICQDQHRKGYCTELGCPNGLFSSEVQTNHPLADLPEYLDCLEADLLSKDLDMRLKDMVQPGIWADRVRAALASRPAGATEQEVVRNALVAYDLTSTDGTVVYAATDKVIGAILAAIPVSSRSASGAEGAPKDVRKIASDAIRTFCQSLDAGTVQTSMGVERIYYSGLRLDALACAVAIAVASADRGGK